MAFREVHKTENNLRFRGFSVRPLNAELLDFVRGRPYAGSVYETEQNPVDNTCFFHRVAGGSGNVGHDCPVVLQQCVQKSTLATVRRTDYGYRNSVSDRISCLERFGQSDTPFNGSVEQPLQFPAVREFHIFFAEIKLEFHQCSKLKQLCTDFAQLGRITSSQLIQGDPVLC